MSRLNDSVEYQFVHYGEHLDPQKGVLALDVGMKTVPGVIDHHHPQAETECTASLITKYPHLVVDHLPEMAGTEGEQRGRLRIITHRLPDFDAVSSIFLALQLLERREPDPHMMELSSYAKMVDSATLPKEINLTATPYSILRALFTGIKKEEEAANLGRVEEGLKFMSFLYSRLKEGYEILQNKILFSGIERYEKAIRKSEEDYFNYLLDVRKSQKIRLSLPLISSQGRKPVDGLVASNPRSFLLKEWARRDRENSPSGTGFSFLMTSFGTKRYILGVDPEKGVNLKGLGDRLNEKEQEKRAQAGRPMPFRWYDGNCPFFNFRIIDSPRDGTSLSHDEIVNCVLDFGQNGKTEKP